MIWGKKKVNSFLSLSQMQFIHIPEVEAATRGVLRKKVFLEISQNSQENTGARVSFLIKLEDSGLQLY